MTIKTETNCRYAGNEHGWLTREHQRDCDDSACTGCKPCPETHCAMRGACPNHVDDDAGIITCPKCIGRVRRDLTAIETLYAIDMPEEAIFAGVDSEAFVLAGAAAAPDQYAARRDWNGEVSEAQDWRRGWCQFPRNVDLDDRHHPFLVLGRWDWTLRDTYGPNTDLFVTVTSAANFLRRLLDGDFPHTREFETFARDIATCRTHLEAVAHDSRTPERGRHCPRCIEQYGKGPRLRKRYAIGDNDKVKRGDLDTWHCPDEPEHWWSERDYRDRVAADYLQHAIELPITDLAARCGVPASTIRRWAAPTRRLIRGEWVETPPRLRPTRHRQDGRKLYRVADIVRLRDGDTEGAS